MRDAFDWITLAVGKIVHRINTPLIAGAVVAGVFDAVHDGVTHVHVGRTQVTHGTQYAGTIREFPVFHAFKQIQVLFNGSTAVGTCLRWHGGIAFQRLDFFLGGIVNVGQAFFDQINGIRVQLREVIRSIKLIVPLGTQPAYVGTNAVDILYIFGDRVRIVKTQVEFALKTLGNAIIHSDGLGVADMEIAIGLWWETGVNPTSMFAIGNVFFDDLLDKIQWTFFFFKQRIVGTHICLVVGIQW